VSNIEKVTGVAQRALHLCSASKDNLVAASEGFGAMVGGRGAGLSSHPAHGV
jgi:hypothetical protein